MAHMATAQDCMTSVWGTPAIEAAGGVLWRYAADGLVEVALVHRPKYDDWSVPKGKLKRREHLLLGAVREVEEETGARVSIGRPLGEIRYLKEGLPKRVRYWAMHAVTSSMHAPASMDALTSMDDVAGLDGFPVDVAEVDRLTWLAPHDALPMLTPGRDAPAIERFMADLRPTWPLVVARHASAGDRAGWTGADTLRPLDDVGAAQAQVLAAILAGYGVVAVHPAEVTRCVDTFTPYANRAGVGIVTEPSLADPGLTPPEAAGSALDPAAGVERMVTLAEAGVATAVCGQRLSMPSLIGGLLSALGAAVPPDLTTRKGGFWVLQLAAGTANSALPEVVSVERFEPLPPPR